MRIAQIAQLWESVPPKRYGGVERVISYLTEELARLGHEVVLFASGDSQTRARLEAVCPRALRLNTQMVCKEAPLVMLLERAFQAAPQFDILHSHLEILAFPAIRGCATPVVSTIHGWVDLPELKQVFREFSEVPLVSVSDAQRRSVPSASWKATVHHGLPRDLYTLQRKHGQYLAFLGRISPDKGTHEVIELGKRTGLPVRIAARVDPFDHQYFQDVIRPLLAPPHVEYVGEITDQEKQAFLGNALALVCASRWPEAFGLVVIEALACGTPVIAYNRGAMPELIQHGVSGFLCEDLAGMERAVEQVQFLNRSRCRRLFEEWFTIERMAQDYLHVYQGVCAEWPQRDGQGKPSATRALRE